MNPPESKPELHRVLGLREGISIHIGNIIGSGIFIVPAIMAARLHALGPIMIVWVVAGLLTLFGALTLAELSSILPQAGGPYIYLREGFGRLWGFLFSWNDFFINKSGSAAALAVAFATYLGYFFPAFSPEHAPLCARTSVILGYTLKFAVGWNQLMAMAIIAVVTLVNVLHVRFSGWVMNVFTLAKVGAILLLILAACFSGKGSISNLGPWWPEHWTTSMIPAYGIAMISALWAYDGWSAVTLTAGEIREPQRNVPRSLILGTILVIVLYLAANLAYAYIIPINEMPGSQRIAADVAHRMLGPVGASLIAVAIMCSTFGTTNGELLTGPRTLFAAGQDGAFAKCFGKVHPRFRTPYVAVLVMGAWSALLTLSGTFEQITAYVVFGSWWFYALTALAVIALRRKMPDAPRPYRAWGYPYATLAFVVVAGCFLINTLFKDFRNALMGIVLILVSLPFYAYWTRSERSAGAR